MASLSDAAKLGNYTTIVMDALRQLEAEQIMERIWKYDHTVWRSEPQEIANRLGWLTSAAEMQANVMDLESLTGAVRAEGYTHALLLGMGGSSLAPDVFRRVFGVREGFLDLQVLDSTDAGAVLAQATRLDLSRTLFIVATKSGGTVETLSFFKFFYNRLVNAFGADEAGKHVVAITDPGSKLEALGERLNFRAILRNNPNIGGRFSVLSYFGMTPAALLGMDVAQLLARAQAMMAACEATVPVAENPGAWMGAVLGTLAKAGRDKVTFVASPSIVSFGDWVEQLVAESTGKEGVGILPVVGENVGSPDSYGEDRLFVYLRLAGDTTYDAAVAELCQAGHPVIQLDLRDIYDLGGQFFLWEMATAVAGHLLDIQPFDQPNVEAAKVLARKMIAEYKEQGVLPPLAFAELKAQSLDTFLEQAEPGDYIAVQAYVQPTPEADGALADLRATLRERTKLAVTTGYGPRFLHSTGQLHKGDAGNGLFIQFVSAAEEDVPIPDAPGCSEATLSFDVLKHAQALGDFQALLDAGRRAIRFDLGKDVLGGLKKLLD